MLTEHAIYLFFLNFCPDIDILENMDQIWCKCRDVSQSVHVSDVDFCCFTCTVASPFSFSYLLHSLIPVLCAQAPMLNLILKIRSMLPTFPIWHDFLHFSPREYRCRCRCLDASLQIVCLFKCPNLSPYYSKCHGIVVSSPPIVACPFLNVPSNFICFSIHTDPVSLTRSPSCIAPPPSVVTVLIKPSSVLYYFCFIFFVLHYIVGFSYHCTSLGLGWLPLVCLFCRDLVYIKSGWCFKKVHEHFLPHGAVPRVSTWGRCGRTNVSMAFGASWFLF